jgi:hypothetical protein
MLRFLSVALTVAFFAAPAAAHEGAGIVHFLSQTDHVIGLIAVIALPVLFWMAFRAKRPKAERRPIRKD